MKANAQPTEQGHFSDGLTPLTVVPAVYDVISAAAALAAGSSHLYLSGGALSASYGYPDNGIMDIREITDVARRIKDTVSVPLMADIETGYGSLSRLSRLTSELLSVGVEAVMIEDQEETGQSVAATPRLCPPEKMCDRIRVIRERVGSSMQILARTDCIAGIPFSSYVERLVKYKEAGADWVMPVFVGKDDLVTAGKTFGSALWVIYQVGPGGYAPSLEDARASGAIAALITAQIRNAFIDMRKTFELTLQGKWHEVRAAMISPAEFSRHLRRDRFDGTTK